MRPGKKQPEKNVSSQPASVASMNITDIEHIIRILKQNEVTEFELEQDGTRIRLTRNSSGGFAVQQNQVAELRPALSTPSSTSAATSSNNDSVAVDDSSRLVKVTSPIVGTFFRKASPDSEVFVKEGDVVKKGDTLCIVEAMKLMNEIESDTSGRVVKILGSDGQVVEYGEVLFLIDPTA